MYWYYIAYLYKYIYLWLSIKGSFSSKKTHLFLLYILEVNVSPIPIALFRSFTYIIAKINQ